MNLSHGWAPMCGRVFLMLRILLGAELRWDASLHRVPPERHYCESHTSAGAGAVCGDADFIRALVDLQVGPVMLMGPTMDAKVASELSLRLAHLGLRMAEHSRRASAYAHRLQQVRHPLYPQKALDEYLQSLAVWSLIDLGHCS